MFKIKKIIWEITGIAPKNKVNKFQYQHLIFLFLESLEITIIATNLKIKDRPKIKKIDIKRINMLK